MKLVRIAVAAFGLATFAAAPALAEGDGCGWSKSRSAETKPATPSVGS